MAIRSQQFFLRFGEFVANSYEFVINHLGSVFDLGWAFVAYFFPIGLYCAFRTKHFVKIATKIVPNSSLATILGSDVIINVSPKEAFVINLLILLVKFHTQV